MHKRGLCVLIEYAKRIPPWMQLITIEAWVLSCWVKLNSQKQSNWRLLFSDVTLITWHPFIGRHYVRLMTRYTIYLLHNFRLSLPMIAILGRSKHNNRYVPIRRVSGTSHVESSPLVINFMLCLVAVSLSFLPEIMVST